MWLRWSWGCGEDIDYVVDNQVRVFGLRYITGPDPCVVYVAPLELGFQGRLRILCVNNRMDVPGYIITKVITSRELNKRGTGPTDRHTTALGGAQPSPMLLSIKFDLSQY
ncbi:MAG: hypothetical protein LAT67_15100 [Balneolales bacterium]|nr:hypothetical protein [Balneolales bacterium]